MNLWALYLSNIPKIGTRAFIRIRVHSAGSIHHALINIIESFQGVFIVFRLSSSFSFFLKLNGSAKVANLLKRQVCQPHWFSFKHFIDFESIFFALTSTQCFVFYSVLIGSCGKWNLFCNLSEWKSKQI